MTPLTNYVPFLDLKVQKQKFTKAISENKKKNKRIKICIYKTIYIYNIQEQVRKVDDNENSVF